MAENSGISWTNHTFNPWWGCVEAGEECDNCYARTFSEGKRRAMWGAETPRIAASEKVWRDLDKWNTRARDAGKPAFVFVASMADILENRRDLDALRARFFEKVQETPWLTYLLLTKRPEMYASLVPAHWHRPGLWPRNVWPGTTCGLEKRKHRVWSLLNNTPEEAIRWVSAEPLLEYVDFTEVIENGIRWVVVGGESGPAGKRRDCGIQAQFMTASTAMNARADVWYKQDSAFRSGEQGRAPDWLWNTKKRPEAYRPRGFQTIAAAIVRGRRS